MPTNSQPHTHRSPVMVVVSLQAWDNSDNAVHIGQAMFDLAPLIAEVPVEDRQQEFGHPTAPGALDHWVETAQDRGLIDPHDGPFFAYSDDLEGLVADGKLDQIPTRRAPRLIPGVVLSEPLTTSQVLAEADEAGIVTATVEVDLEDMLNARTDSAVGGPDEHDLLAAKVSPLPALDCSYELKGVSGAGGLIIEFTTNVHGAGGLVGHDEGEVG